MKRDRNLFVRVTGHEYASYKDAARRNGQSLSEWVRLNLAKRARYARATKPETEDTP